MNRCLNEAALLRVHFHESTEREESHLRVCADCAEHYEQLVEDLQAIGQVLETPPAAAREASEIWDWRRSWLPLAVGAAALLVLALDMAWLRMEPPTLAPLHASRSHSGDGGPNLTAFAADLSDAIFPAVDDNSLARLTIDAPYVEAALEVGQPCTRQGFLDGECSDQVSALLIDSQ